MVEGGWILMGEEFTMLFHKEPNKNVGNKHLIATRRASLGAMEHIAKTTKQGSSVMQPPEMIVDW